MKAVFLAATLANMSSPALAQKAAPKEQEKAQESTFFSEAAMIVDAMTFFRTDGDDLALETLTQRVLEGYWMQPRLIETVLENSIRSSNRDLLHTQWFDFYEKNNCAKNPPRPHEESIQSCGLLQQIWQETITGLMFYEDSAPKLESARRALTAKDCAQAQVFLEQVRSREGIFPRLLKMQISTAVCQKDKASANKLRDELAKLQPFSAE